MIKLQKQKTKREFEAAWLINSNVKSNIVVEIERETDRDDLEAYEIRRKEDKHYVVDDVVLRKANDKFHINIMLLFDQFVELYSRKSWFLTELWGRLYLYNIYFVKN